MNKKVKDFTNVNLMFEWRPWDPVNFLAINRWVWYIINKILYSEKTVRGVIR